MLLFLKFYYQNQTRHLYNYFLDVPLILLEIIISISLIYSNYIYFYTTLQLSVAIYLLLKNKKKNLFLSKTGEINFRDTFNDTFSSFIFHRNSNKCSKT